MGGWGDGGSQQDESGNRHLLGGGAERQNKFLLINYFINFYDVFHNFKIISPGRGENGILTFDDYRQGETKCCSIINDKNESLVKSCNKELIFVLGEDGYKDLLQMENDFNKK